jgi:outer membrane protein TolC
MRKLKLLFGLVIFLMVYNSAKAQQQTIMNDVSEAYIAKLVARAEANYPTVRSNQNRINAAEANVGKAKASYLEALTFSYIYQPNGVNTLNSAGNKNTNFTFNGIQAGIYFNLGTFLEKPYAVKEARQQLEIANNDQNTYFLTLTNMIKKRYYTYIGTIAMLKFTTQSSVDAQSLFNDIKHKFEKGEASFDQYTQAQTSLTASYQSKVQAETSLLIAKADIEELLGDKLENIR